MIELSLHILDIAQNSIRAKAGKIEISIVEKSVEDIYEITISDDGPGMDKEMLSQVESPFFTSRKTRKVGLGIPLFKQNAEQTGGSFYITSTQGEGTLVKADFGFSNVDRPVLGDIAGTLLILLTNENDTEIVYTHQTPVGEYVFDSREVKEVLDGTPLTTPEIRNYLLEMIRENLDQIQISE